MGTYEEVWSENIVGCFEASRERQGCGANQMCLESGNLSEIEAASDARLGKKGNCLWMRARRTSGDWGAR